MAYIKNVWQDMDENDRDKFTRTVHADGTVELQPVGGGTMIDAEKMNRLETALENRAPRIMRLKLMNRLWSEMPGGIYMMIFVFTYAISTNTMLKIDLGETLKNLRADLEWETRTNSIIFRTAARPDGDLDATMILTEI